MGPFQAEVDQTVAEAHHLFIELGSRIIINLFVFVESCQNLFLRNDPVDPLQHIPYAPVFTVFEQRLRLHLAFCA